MIFKTHFNSIFIFESIYSELFNYGIDKELTYNDYIIKYINELLSSSPFRICTDLKFGDIEVYVDDKKVLDYLMSLDPVELLFIKMEWRNSDVIGTKHPEYVKLYNIITRKFTMDKDFIKNLCNYIKNERI